MTEKEQNKNPTASPKEEKPETPLTEEQRQKRRKMLVYPLMGLLFAGSMWLIFAPSDKDKAEAQQGVGFNTEMPLPVEAGIIADKRTAYEQAKMEEKQKERRAQMNDLAALFSDKDDKAETQSEEFDLLDPEPQQPARNYGGGSRPQRTIRSSAAGVLRAMPATARPDCPSTCRDVRLTFSWAYLSNVCRSRFSRIVKPSMVNPFGLSSEREAFNRRQRVTRLRSVTLLSRIII